MVAGAHLGRRRRAVLRRGGPRFGGAVLWAAVAFALFGSGVYWTQAVVSVAVESIRQGEELGPVDALRRAIRRVNGLSVALVLIAAGNAAEPA
jgi:hypothetical protein